MKEVKIQDFFHLTPYEEEKENKSYKEKIEEIIDGFLKQTDWRIYENANRAITYYSLLSHIVQHAIALYSLDKLPEDYAFGHKTGWWHIHDLGISGIFIRYCSGLDMEKFLLDGFKPVLPNTATSTPPKHFSTVLDHLLNFFTIFSHECFSEDTKILTENGWKYFYELDKNEKVATFNFTTKKVEYQNFNEFIEKDYNGKLIHFRGLEILTTPLHSMFVYDDRINDYTGRFAVDLFDLDTRKNISFLSIPVMNNNLEIKDHFKIEGHISLKDYNGKVYCVKVPNNSLIVKRKDKAIISSNCAGAVSVASLDVYCAPFIRKDRYYYAKILGIDPYSEEMDKFIRKYVYQTLQRFVWNLNYPLRAGFEALFTNITLDLSVHKSGLADRNCIWYGQIIDDMKYSELQDEVNLFNECLFDIKLKGMPDGRPFTFPIITINLTDDFDDVLSDELKEMVYKCTARYGEFYFQNCISGELGLKKINPEDVRSMAILPDQKLICKDLDKNKIFIDTIEHIYENRNEDRIGVLMGNDFYQVKSFYRIPYKRYEKYIEVTLENNVIQRFSWDHKCIIWDDENRTIKECLSQDLQVADKFLISLEPINRNDGIYEDYLLGLFIGYSFINGNFRDDTLTIYLHKNDDNRDRLINLLTMFDVDFELNQNEEGFNSIKVYYNNIKDNIFRYFKVYDNGRKELIPENIIPSSQYFINGFISSIKRIKEKSKSSFYYVDYSRKNLDMLYDIFISNGEITQIDIINMDIYDKKIYVLKEFYPKKIITYDNKVFALMHIKSINELESNLEYVYDFTIDRKDHLYTLPNGILTHQCCRLNLDKSEIYRRVGGLFSGGSTTGSICVTTMNLPRYGYIVNNYIVKSNIISSQLEAFDNLLDDVMDIIINGMVTRKKLILEHSTKRYNLAPFIKAYEHPDMPTYFITVGFVGLNECLINMGLEKGLSKPENIETGEKIMSIILNKAKKYQEKYDTLINIEATPAEGAAYRLAKLDKKYFYDPFIKNKN